MIRPRIFLSYARTDLVDAKQLFEILDKQGCTVWMDLNEILAGDDFVRGLQDHLSRSDALVFLLTRQSAESSWCLAELQYALGRGLVVIIVERAAGSLLPEAVERVLRDVQRVPWSEVSEKLGRQILRARSRGRRRVLGRAAALLGAAGGLSLVGIQVAQGINRFDAERRREAFVADLRSASMVWSGEEVRARLRPVSDDPDLPGILHQLAEDPALAPTLRVNAWQGLGALRDERQVEWRTFIEDIQWKGGRLNDMLWANTTYRRGLISGLVAERVRMAGLVFGPGPNADEAGLTLGGILIRDADIWFMKIAGTQMIDVIFENCKFRGAQLDLSEASAVQFVSREESQVVLSTDVAIIEDSSIAYLRPAPEPGVMDLSEPEQDLIFDGVQFVRVQFEGILKATWFTGCHFENCVFPRSLAETDLEKWGNTFQGPWLSRP